MPLAGESVMIAVVYLYISHYILLSPSEVFRLPMFLVCCLAKNNEFIL